MRSHFFDVLRRAWDTTFLVLLGIYVFGLAGCIPFTVISDPEPTPVIVNHLVEETKGLSEIWSKNDVYLLWGNKALDASMGTGCFLGDLGVASEYNQIVCLDSATGDIKWKRESFLNGILTVSPAGVFVTYIRVPNTLSRYDLQSGKLVWREEWYESNPIYMEFFDNQIQVITRKPGRNLWVFDTDGNIVEVLDNTQAFLKTQEVTFFYENGIQAVRTDTNDVLWHYEDPVLNLMPVFTEDKIFCRNERNSGTVYALNRKTGKLLWQVSDIVYHSNVAYSPKSKLVYALRNNGDLLAINESTGETSIAAKFSSAPFLFNISETGESYKLAYDQEHKILLVALGDSHQLYAFREK